VAFHALYPVFCKLALQTAHHTLHKKIFSLSFFFFFFYFPAHDGRPKAGPPKRFRCFGPVG
jgi:hypothetical protein